MMKSSPAITPSAAEMPRGSNRPTQSGRKFYVGMAFVALAIAFAGFGPAIIHSEGRRAPMNLTVALHGMVFTGWLVLFLIQSLLISTGNVRIHRRLGFAATALAVTMVVTGYLTATAMARRGFDLSGDLHVEKDPLGLLVFQLGDLLSFAILVGFAVACRRRAQIHKRLMLLATVGSLMAAPLSHVIGQIPALQSVPPIILVPLALLYSSHAIYDRFTRGRIHPVSLWVPIALFVWANLRAAVIGPSAWWRELAGWLVE